MNAKSLLLAPLLGVSLNCMAADLRNAEEGTPAQRAQLNAIQGKPAPALQVKDWLNGNAVSLGDLKGKIVVLDFWATWCGPCIVSIPHNNQVADKYRAQGVVFIGICHPKGMEKMAATVKEKGLKYPTAKDPDGATIKAYQVNGFPDYHVIDRKGILRVADCKNAQVEQVILALLKEGR